ERLENSCECYPVYGRKLGTPREPDQRPEPHTIQGSGVARDNTETRKDSDAGCVRRHSERASRNQAICLLPETQTRRSAAKQAGSLDARVATCSSWPVTHTESSYAGPHTRRGPSTAQPLNLVSAVPQRCRLLADLPLREVVLIRVGH